MPRSGSAEALSKDALPLMLAAWWVRDGRTPRTHQARYTAFLDVVDNGFAVAGVTTTLGHRAYANQNLLPIWLEDVAAGNSPQSATERLIRQEGEHIGEDSEFGEKVAAVFQRVAHVWARMLEGIVIANDGEIVVIFHEDELNLGYELRDVFGTVLPAARLLTHDFSWIAGRAPAVLALFLAERRKGLIGLVLEREHTEAFDSDTCALFLRNAVTLLEQPELAAFVESDLGTPEEAAFDRKLPLSGLHWQSTGFATGFDDRGLTRTDLLPALLAAHHGREVPAPKRPGRSRRA